MVIELLTRQPTMLRTNTSITKGAYSHPCEVEMYLKSDTRD